MKLVKPVVNNKMPKKMLIHKSKVDSFYLSFSIYLFRLNMTVAI